MFSGLLLAIVDSFFLLRPPRRQLLIFGRDHRWLTGARGAIQALDDELGTIAREDFFFGRLPLTVLDLFSFLGPLRNHLLMLERDGRSGLR